MKNVAADVLRHRILLNFEDQISRVDCVNPAALHQDGLALGNRRSVHTGLQFIGVQGTLELITGYSFRQSDE